MEIILKSDFIYENHENYNIFMKFRHDGGP